MKKLLIMTSAAAVAAVSHAGVKYWDNPDFRAYDVGDYVQDGLVLHYDGIRNVGADEEHSTTSDTWVNLASGGSLPLTWCSWISSDSKYQRVRNNTTQGAWEEDGFHFNGQSVFATEESSNLFSLPETYTMQFTMTADLSKATGTSGSGYLFMPGKSWEQGSVGVRNSANGSITPANAVYVVDNARFNTNNTRPNFADATPRYATVLGTSASLACFDGTSIPAVGTTYTDSCRANVKTRSAHANNWIAFGAQYYNSTQTGATRDSIESIQGFNGTLHAVRYYNKALTYEDLAWNRVVDQNRFFGESAPIPVTNIVVATAVEGVDGDQPCGAYALDAEGFTFTAPAQRTIKGKRYVLTGYTIETWNVSDWGAAVEHDGNSYDAKSAGKVRLTWRYARPAGEGQLKTYDVGDYVQGGLLLHYDGICNVGANAAHDPAAHQWKNIAPGYESRWPMDWCSYTESSANNYAWHRNDYTQGAWTDDGFAFNGKGYFAKWNDGDPFAIPANFTVQISVTGAIADQLGDPSYLWTGQLGYYLGSIAMRKSDRSAADGNANSVYYINQAVHTSARPNFYPAGAKPSYVTAIVDYDDTKASYIFDGTTRPTKGGYDAPAINGTSPATNLTWFSVGGFHGRSGTAANLQSFNGTVHNFRFYNRVLTDAEVAQNRKVDEYRIHGRYADPNVIVQSTYSYLEGYDKCGPYEVDGSYTFAAPETVTAPNGITYACDGYTVETRDANGIWGGAVSHDGTSYRYETSAGTVRLTWKWRATGGRRTAADYSLDDYSPAGLVLNYDGIHNDGADKPHSTTTQKWKNLAQGWEDQDMYAVNYSLDNDTGNYNSINVQKNNLEMNGKWNEKGYVFDGKECFMKWNEGRKFILPPAYTWQFAMNATTAGQSASNGGISYLFLPHDGNSNGSWKNGSVQMRVDASGAIPANSIVLTDEPRYGTTDIRPCFSDPSPRFATVLADSTAACVFGGVEIPTSEPECREGNLAVTRTNNWFVIGGQFNPSSGRTLAHFQGFHGTMHSVRFYDRPLTAEELKRNREADSARFFGELATTNVFVVAGGGTQAETGAYKVEGSWDFTAQTVSQDGATKAVAGYWTEERLNGDWVNKKWHEGTTYSYKEGTSPAAVRLTWGGPRPGMMIIVK